MKKAEMERIANECLLHAIDEINNIAHKVQVEHIPENRHYVVKVDPVNGLKYVTLESVNGIVHVSKEGNDKTGPCYAYNFSPFHSCDHTCECYYSGICYACKGFYQFGSNMADYAENMKFYLEHSIEQTATEIIKQVLEHGENILFRWFTSGDIPNPRFLDMMIIVAYALPYIKFWSYTKKYSIVNRFCDQFGKATIPENLTIVFSHWMNKDGSYFPMDNPYNFPTSEFIPEGMENLITENMHICPCSDPSVYKTCATCDKPCHSLKEGESMALCEHSSKNTKKRDAELRAAKQAIKETTGKDENKAYKAEARKTARNAIAELKASLKLIA